VDSQHLFKLALAGLTAAICSAAKTAPPQGAAASEDGSVVLKRAQERGVKPRSDCFHVDLAKNEFFAPANAECTVTLDFGSWLKSSWTYVDSTGKGRFKKSAEGAVVTVAIDAGGGFTLRALTVSSTTVVTEGACNSTKVSDVLK
jgi:hypothetical protein